MWLGVVRLLLCLKWVGWPCLGRGRGIYMGSERWVALAQWQQHTPSGRKWERENEYAYGRAFSPFGDRPITRHQHFCTRSFLIRPHPPPPTPIPKLRKLTSNQEGGLLMPKINSLVNVFPICLRKRLEVEILVSPTYHVSAFLVTDVFDKIWDMNILQCRWLEIHCLLFQARNLLLTSLNWERESSSQAFSLWILEEQGLSWMWRMLGCIFQNTQMLHLLPKRAECEGCIFQNTQMFHLLPKMGEEVF